MSCIGHRITTMAQFDRVATLAQKEFDSIQNLYEEIARIEQENYEKCIKLCPILAKTKNSMEAYLTCIGCKQECPAGKVDQK